MRNFKEKFYLSDDMQKAINEYYNSIQSDEYGYYKNIQENHDYDYKKAVDEYHTPNSYDTFHHSETKFHDGANYAYEDAGHGGPCSCHGCKCKENMPCRNPNCKCAHKHCGNPPLNCGKKHSDSDLYEDNYMYENNVFDYYKKHEKLTHDHCDPEKQIFDDSGKYEKSMNAYDYPYDYGNPAHCYGKSMPSENKYHMSVPEHHESDGKYGKDCDDKAYEDNYLHEENVFDYSNKHEKSVHDNYRSEKSAGDYDKKRDNPMPESDIYQKPMFEYQPPAGYNDHDCGGGKCNDSHINDNVFDYFTNPTLGYNKSHMPAPEYCEAMDKHGMIHCDTRKNKHDAAYHKKHEKPAQINYMPGKTICDYGENYHNPISDHDDYFDKPEYDRSLPESTVYPKPMTGYDKPMGKNSKDSDDTLYEDNYTPEMSVAGHGNKHAQHMRANCFDYEMPAYDRNDEKTIYGGSSSKTTPISEYNYTWGICEIGEEALYPASKNENKHDTLDYNFEPDHSRTIYNAPYENTGKAEILYKKTEMPYFSEERYYTAENKTRHMKMMLSDTGRKICKIVESVLRDIETQFAEFYDDFLDMESLERIVEESLYRVKNYLEEFHGIERFHKEYALLRILLETIVLYEVNCVKKSDKN